MLTEERRALILSSLDELGSVTVADLMREYDASESTIRRDLNALDQEGRLTKVHGGALSKKVSYTTKDDEVDLRKCRNIDEKKRIVEYAASLIRAEDFIYIDAGTTTELMIDYITEKEAMYVTNGIEHARKLSKKGCEVFLIGGEYKYRTEAVVGEEAVASIEKYNFTKGFFGTNGVTIQNGYTTPEIREALVKRRAMEKTMQKYILADSSKFNQISNITFGEFFNAIVITTELQSAEYKAYQNIVEVK